MEMCPYCGEDVPSDTPKCWKCGTELSERTPGAEDVELRGPAAERAEEESKKKKKKPMRQCPYCETMVPLHSLRCNRCGKALKDPLRQLQWQKGVWIAFTLALLGVVGWMIYEMVLNTPVVARTDPGRDDPIQVSYDNLARIFLQPQGAGEDQRRASWDLEHRGRYVVWDGAITRVLDAEAGILEANSSMTASIDKPQVRIELKEPDDMLDRGLKHGKLIKYSARLVSYHPDQGVFVLDNAELID